MDSSVLGGCCEQGLRRDGSCEEGKSRWMQVCWSGWKVLHRMYTVYQHLCTNTWLGVVLLSRVSQYSMWISPGKCIIPDGLSVNLVVRGQDACLNSHHQDPPAGGEVGGPPGAAG